MQPTTYQWRAHNYYYPKQHNIINKSLSNIVSFSTAGQYCQQQHFFRLYYVILSATAFSPTVYRQKHLPTSSFFVIIIIIIINNSNENHNTNNHHHHNHHNETTNLNRKATDFFSSFDIER